MRVLKKAKDRDFIVLNLSDPQLSNQEWQEGRAEGRNLTKTVTCLINKVKPDLITVSGDLAWAGHYESYEHLADLLDSFGIPWAPVFGNHDNQGGAEQVEKAAEILRQRKHCLLERGDPALGYGNYVIGIEEEGHLLHALLLMDSHDRKLRSEEEPLYWAELIPEQFVWYREQISALKALGAKETSLILHIPLYTYRDAFHAAKKETIDRFDMAPEDGAQVGCWNEGYEDSFGVVFEEEVLNGYPDGICSYPDDNGFFDEILQNDSTKLVLCGHDHINSLSVCYRGVRLMYGLKTGSGCYWDKRLNGGTVLRIDSDGHVSAEHCFYVANA